MSKQIPYYKEGAALPPQEVLDLYANTFGDELLPSNEENLKAQVQVVKGLLYHRNYLGAFDNVVNRAAYVCRWSPSRSLCYSSLLTYLEPVLETLTTGDSNILCIGGGAGGELVSYANIFTMCNVSNPNFNGTMTVDIIDIANWDDIINRLRSTISTKWLYQDDRNERFVVNFQNRDALAFDDYKRLGELDLITIMFTANELFTEQRTATMHFLQKLNEHCKPGCKLLIVESAGSYSHITLTSGKKFPIQFLLDTVLTGTSGKQAPKKHQVESSWELLANDDSTWYRNDTEAMYAMKLENMRFFYRLYQHK
ncbi:25S rRNA (uracil2843-N3)-methyltransferase RNJ42_02280 [Nakaseomyces bracarensis]|uniref:25S rRNA (uracil2843-N3)-methyltransferase n=1 Tax=Nakaseomyces bracarensis TaxID=273131 RepID=UPI0038724781